MQRPSDQDELREGKGREGNGVGSEHEEAEALGGRESRQKRVD